MDLTFTVDALLKMAAGVPLTLRLAASSVLLGALLGLAFALMRLAGSALLRAFAWVYVQLIRSIPLLVLMFLVYYGLGQFQLVRSSALWPFLREPYWCALTALTINTSAYASEVIRGGLLSVPRGQIEAARACGMPPLLMFRRIVLPIAIRQAIPAYGNEIVAMVKATSLASLVTLMEVTGIATSIASETYRPVEVFVAAGMIYLAINFALARGVGFLEYRLTAHLRPRPNEPLAALAGGTPT